MAISFSPVNFSGNHNIKSKSSLKEKVVLTKENAKELFSDKKLRNAFLAGTISGILLTGGVSAQYNNYQTKKVMEDMKENLDNNDYDAIEINDVTNDNTPDIILRDKNGDADIYDIKSHKIYVKIGDELIEKMD